MMALGLSGIAGYRLYLKNNSEKRLQDAISADERAIDLACRFGYSVPQCLSQPRWCLEGAGGADAEETAEAFTKTVWRRCERVPARLGLKWHSRKDPAVP